MDSLFGSQQKRDRLRSLLKDVADLERLIGRIPLGTATPRDVVALRRSLDQVPPIREVIAGEDEPSLIQILRENADEIPTVRQLVAEALKLELPKYFTHIYCTFENRN